MRLSHFPTKAEKLKSRICFASATILISLGYQVTGVSCRVSVSGIRLWEALPSRLNFEKCDHVEVRNLTPGSRRLTLTTRYPALFQIFIERRMQQGLILRSIQVVERNHGHARINSFFDRLALQRIGHGTDAEVAHVGGILHHNAMQLFRLHGFDKNIAGVKTDEGDLAGFADVLKREQHAG